MFSSKKKRLTIYSTEEVLKKLRRNLKKDACYVVSKFEEDRFGYDSISYQNSYLSIDKTIETVSSLLLGSFGTFTVSAVQDGISIDVVNMNYRILVLNCNELGKSLFRR